MAPHWPGKQENNKHQIIWSIFAIQFVAREKMNPPKNPAFAHKIRCFFRQHVTCKFLLHQTSGSQQYLQVLVQKKVPRFTYSQKRKKKTDGWEIIFSFGMV